MTKTRLMARWAAVLATPTAAILLVVHNPTQTIDLAMTAAVAFLGACVGYAIGEVRGLDW